MTIKPRLRTILLILNLIILLLPVGGIAVFRLYENEMVRQTESELTGQATLIVAYYKREYLKLVGNESDLVKRTKTIKGNLITATPVEDIDQALTPALPALDLAKSRVFPPAAISTEPDKEPDPLAKMAAEALVPIIAEAKKINLSGIRIVDYQGIVIASSGDDMGKSLIQRQEVALATQGKPNSLLRERHSKSPKPALESISRGTSLRVFVAFPITIENRIVGAVITSRTPLDVTKALYASRFQLLKGSLFVVLIVFLITILVTRFISRPVQALIRQVNQIKAGDQQGQTKVKNPAIEEVEKLSAAIAEMASTIEQRTGYIKTFAQNVSHEFKTPLTSLRGAVELIRDHHHDMSTEELYKFFDIIENETGHLDKMVRRLLELARADVYKHEGEIAEIRPVIENMQRRYDGKKLNINVIIDNRIKTVNMSTEVFTAVISNLLENALFHNDNGCAIRINISTDSERQGGIHMLVSDDGKGISAANAARIFRPFFTTARKRGGSGLGLTIIKSLIEAHGGSIKLLKSIKGASFSIKI